ncbi:hypothetical protein LCGC14_1319310 [marine sediment metagenome]|uniref:Uncharacterized protein n=1 Tax=marine sediment metagenome TaxID=412755 RepID=A0A0F9NMA1_9ZZZZ
MAGHMIEEDQFLLELAHLNLCICGRYYKPESTDNPHIVCPEVQPAPGTRKYAIGGASAKEGAL